MLKMRNLFLFCFFLALILTLGSCRSDVTEKINGADTLAAVATNAQTVIYSIMEKSFAGQDGFYFNRSPEYLSDSVRFYVECFFRKGVKLPELIVVTTNKNDSSMVKISCLNQNNALYFVSHLASGSAGLFEKRGFYQKNKLRFADLRKSGLNESSARFVLMSKEEMDTSFLAIGSITPLIEKWLSAFEVKSNYELVFDTLIQENGLPVIVAKTSDKLFNVRFIANDTLNKMPAKGQRFQAIYHHNGNAAYADSIIYQ